MHALEPNGTYDPMQVNGGTSSNSSEGGQSPKIENGDHWIQSGDSVYRMGKVGINTSEPSEALTVHGSILNIICDFVIHCLFKVYLTFFRCVNYRRYI